MAIDDICCPVKGDRSQNCGFAGKLKDFRKMKNCLLVRDCVVLPALQGQSCPNAKPVVA